MAVCELFAHFHEFCTSKTVKLVHYAVQSCVTLFSHGYFANLFEILSVLAGCEE